MKSNKSFTITEILVVVVIMSIVAAFAIPAYQRSVLKSEQRNLMMLARAFYGAVETYKAQNGDYWPACNESNLNVINNALGTNFYPVDGYDFEYTYVPGTLDKGLIWNLEIESTAAGDNWEIRVHNGPLDDQNPCCDLEGDPAEKCRMTVCVPSLGGVAGAC